MLTSFVLYSKKETIGYDVCFIFITLFDAIKTFKKSLCVHNLKNEYHRWYFRELSFEYISEFLIKSHKTS